MFRLCERTGTLTRRGYQLHEAESVFRRYRGFDGFPWTRTPTGFNLKNGLAASDQLDDVLSYYDGLPDRGDCDLIGLDRAGDLGAMFTNLRWLSAGFDVGYFESEWAHYSGILNEVLFGVHPQLRAFSTGLNEHLLLRTRQDVDAFLSEHVRIAQSGGDVDRDLGFTAIEIYVPGKG